MTQTITYDTYIATTAYDILVSNLSMWKPYLTDLYYNEFVKVLSALNELVLKNKPQLSTLEYELKDYRPAILPIVQYSFMYEYESLVDEIIDNDSLTADERAFVISAYYKITAMMDTWFDHMYGYTTEELEEDMFKSGYGVFGISL